MSAAARFVRRRRLAANLKRANVRVTVGWPVGKADDGVIERAIYNEFGTTDDGGKPVIPARPALSISIRSNAKRYEEWLRRELRQRLLGKRTDEQIAERLGIKAAGDVQQSITDLEDPPNAPSTIKAKGSSNPLIDSGEMRRAVTWDRR